MAARVRSTGCPSEAVTPSRHHQAEGGWHHQAVHRLLQPGCHHSPTALSPEQVVVTSSPPPCLHDRWCYKNGQDGSPALQYEREYVNYDAMLNNDVNIRPWSPRVQIVTTMEISDEITMSQQAKRQLQWSSRHHQHIERRQT